MTPFVRCLAYLLLALAVGSCQLPVASAQTLTPKVRYSLALYQPGTTTRAVSVRAGQEFDLALFAQDLRPAGTYVDAGGQTRELLRGVWAAYASVRFNSSAVKVGGATFTMPYLNGRQAAAGSSGLAVLGAFDGFSPIGSELLEVARVRCTAQWPAGVAGSVSQVNVGFGLDFRALDHPQFDTLVLGNVAANPPEASDVALSEIVASGAVITVVK
jgi:hypothetical protein